MMAPLQIEQDIDKTYMVTRVLKEQLHEKAITMCTMRTRHRSCALKALLLGKDPSLFREDTSRTARISLSHHGGSSHT